MTAERTAVINTLEDLGRQVRPNGTGAKVRLMTKSHPLLRLSVPTLAPRMARYVVAGRLHSGWYGLATHLPIGPFASAATHMAAGLGAAVSGKPDDTIHAGWQVPMTPMGRHA